MRSLLFAIAVLAAVPATAAENQSCFQYETDTAGSVLTLMLPEGDGPVAGVERGGVQDKAQGYFTSWESAVAGFRKGDKLEMTVKTAIENDFQVEEQVWRIEDGAVVTERDRFEPIDCGMVAQTGFDNVPEHATDDITRGHCGPDDDVVLSCQITDDDVLSVCSATETQALTYFYGPVVAPELEFPKEKAGSMDKFMIHSIGYARGYDTRLAFETGPFTYVVHERMIAGEQGQEPTMEGGVTLYENGKTKMELFCMGLSEAGGGLNNLIGRVKEKEFFDEEGLKK